MRTYRRTDGRRDRHDEAISRFPQFFLKMQGNKMFIHRVHHISPLYGAAMKEGLSVSP